MQKKDTLGVIVGNRGFFPDHLADSGRKEALAVLAAQGIDAICLTPEDSKFGSVETRADVKKCVDLFKKNADKISGILVTLPNFGDERGVAETIRGADLGVPVLVQATPDDMPKMSLADRRDGFCGKMSVCNNLRQYGLDYTLTTLHTESLSSDVFKADLAQFMATCRVVNGLTGLRIGSIGARVAPFNTVRYSEKILEANGISVEVVDLSEILRRVGKLDDNAAEVQAKVAEVKDYLPCQAVPDYALIRMAKLAHVVDEWNAEVEVDISAFQCWDSIEATLGIVPCSVMSMLNNKLTPCACEVDVTGAIGMYALTLAAGVPAALLDWNNNYADDPDKCVLFHCSAVPTGCMTTPGMAEQDILAGTVGWGNTWGACVGRMKSGPFTYARVSTDDEEGMITAYLGEGTMTDDPLDTFGGVGVAQIPDLQQLLRYICTFGFEHHVAIAHAQVGAAIAEAWETYMGWDVYEHG